MPGPQPPSRQSSVSSNPTGVDAALVGAATAFGRNVPVQRSSPNTGIAGNVGDSGALPAAAAAAARDSGQQQIFRTLSRSPLPPPLSRSPVGSISGGSRQQRISMDLTHVPNLAFPQQAGAQHAKSASQQAAVLAASRARPYPLAVRPAVAPKPRRFSGQRGEADFSDNPTDTTPIPPTTSLVDLFERKSKSNTAVNSTPESKFPVLTPVTSPKVKRSGITSMFQLELDESSPLGTPRPARGIEGEEGSRPLTHRHSDSSEDSFASASEDMSPGSAAVIDSTRPQSPSPDLAEGTRGIQNKARRSPVSVSPLRSTVSKPLQIRQTNAVSRDHFPTSSSMSTKSIQAQYKQAYPRPGRMTPLTTGDQLANALVASSLASSRAPSPTRLEPPPVPARRRRNLNHHHNVLGFSRTPSPAKAGMLHTLRPQDSSSESDSDAELHPYGKHRKKRLVRKHPNKHHEGDRKRWRDAVTERERKRYEGVWAANKGVHYSFTEQEEQLFRQAPNSERTLEIKSAATEQVSNIVARELWSRSRLPEATLETVWDLVDHDAVGRLSREEFVVGMWLIDLRLKGRKLPVKVTESVWASVRSLHGIKIRK